jgi:hypothetical protein
MLLMVCSREWRKRLKKHASISVAFNPDKFDKLITSLRTAVDVDGTLDKYPLRIMIYLMLSN